MRSYYYGLDNAYVRLEREETFATCRGPGFVECHDRYDARTGSQWGLAGMTVIVPKVPAPGLPWVFRADPIGRDATVDQALLARGFHIVVAPLIAQSGPVREQWDATYKLLVDRGFSSKPVMEGAGTAAGEAYAWAIENPDKVSCIYAENPALRSLMAREQPLDHLDALARAGVPLIHACGSLDPWLEGQTRVAEARYKEFGGQITVIVDEGRGHHPTAPRDPKPVVDLILARRKESPTRSGSKPRYYGFDGAISREVLDHFLSRSISYDEITWFAHQDERYRGEWLRHAWDWVRKADPNGHLQMPGSRTVRSPEDGKRWYHANRPGPAVPDGLGDEVAIRAIWAADPES